MSSGLQRVLFLCVEGVLTQSRGGRLDQGLLANLEGLVRRTGAGIVLCCPWRSSPITLQLLAEAFDQAQVPRWAAATTSIADAPVGFETTFEVLAWLRAHPKVVNWAFVSPTATWGLHPHTFQTVANEGLTLPLANSLSDFLLRTRYAILMWKEKVEREMGAGVRAIFNGEEVALTPNSQNRATAV